MRIPLITLLAAGLVLVTGCPAANDDPDELETVPEAPTRPPLEQDAPQLEHDPLAPDPNGRDTVPEAGEPGNDRD